MISPVIKINEVQSFLISLDNYLEKLLKVHLEGPIEYEIIDHHYDLIEPKDFKNKIIDEKTQFILKFKIPFKENNFDMYITLYKGMMDTLFVSKIFLKFDIGYLDLDKSFQPLTGYDDGKEIFFETENKKATESLNQNMEFLTFLKKNISYKSNSKNIEIKNPNFLYIDEHKILFTYPLKVDESELLNLDLFGKITLINKILKRIMQIANGDN